MKTAIRDNDPVHGHGEHPSLRRKMGGSGRRISYSRSASLTSKRHGTDITTDRPWTSVITCLKAAEILAAEHEINAEVVDLRSIRPLDE